MSRERGLLALAVVLLVVLAGLTLAQPPARELATFTAPTEVSTGVGSERLARAVRYADLRLSSRGTVRVGVRGEHGGVLLSLVDADDRVREVHVEEGESVAHFGAVDAGEYALRALAAPPEPPSSADTVTIRAATGGRPWTLFGAAALLVLAPPLVLAARKRSAARDGEPTNR